MKMLPVLSLLLLLLPSTQCLSYGLNAPVCQIDSVRQQLLQSGSILFKPRAKSGRERSHTAKIHYPVPASGVSHIVSISSIQGLIYPVGNDYTILGHAHQKAGHWELSITLLFTGSWSSITVNYIASSRSDVFMGTVVVVTSSTYGSSLKGSDTSNFTMTSKVAIQNWQPALMNQKITIMKVFITGLRSSPQTTVLLNLTQLNQTTGVLTINSTFVSKTFVECLELSYLVVVQNYSSPFIYNLQPSKQFMSVLDTYHTFTSMASVSEGVPVYYYLFITLDRITCLTAACPSLCVSQFICEKIMAQPNKGYCLLADEPLPPACDKNSIMDPKTNTCQRCLSPTVPSIKKDRCVSPQARSNALTPTLAVVSNITQAFICPAGMTFGQNQCNCPDAYVYDAKSKNCSCSPASILLPTSPPTCQYCFNHSRPSDDLTTCVCLKGYYLSSPTVCTKAPDCALGATFMSKERGCSCVNSDQILINNTCQCPQHTVLSVKNSIQRCLCNRTSYNNTLLRPSGLCMECGANSDPDPTGYSCICKKNYIFNPQSKTCSNRCGPGLIADNLSKACICPIHNMWLYPNNTCSCPPNSVLSGGRCACDQYSIIYNSNCNRCWPNSSPNSNGDDCVCNTNYYLSGRSTCTLQPTCIGGAEWDPNIRACKCPTSSMILNADKICACPPGLTLNNLMQCVCSPDPDAPVDCGCNQTYIPQDDGCFPPSRVFVSVVLFSNICSPGRLIVAFCATIPGKQFTSDSLGCNCSITANVNVTWPLTFRPVIKVYALLGSPGCFLTQFTDPQVQNTAFNFTTYISNEKGEQVTGPTFYMDNSIFNIVSSSNPRLLNILAVTVGNLSLHPRENSPVALGNNELATFMLPAKSTKPISVKPRKSAS